MDFDLIVRPGSANYDLITQTLVPRPIAWILSANADDSLNLAPFSYFNAVASQPALFSVSIGLRRDGHLKDTRRNLVEGRPAVVHIASAAQIDAVNESAAGLPPGESEVEAQGLETVPFGKFPLPRLKDAPVAFGCRLYQEVELTGLPQGLLVLQAVCAHVDDELVEKTDDPEEFPRIDTARLDPLARLGRTEYSSIKAPVSRPRPG